MHANIFDHQHRLRSNGYTLASTQPRIYNFKASQQHNIGFHIEQVTWNLEYETDSNYISIESFYNPSQESQEKDTTTTYSVVRIRLKLHLTPDLVRAYTFPRSSTSMIPSSVSFSNRSLANPRASSSYSTASSLEWAFMVRVRAVCEGDTCCLE